MRLQRLLEPLIEQFGAVRGGQEQLDIDLPGHGPIDLLDRIQLAEGSSHEQGRLDGRDRVEDLIVRGH